MRHHQCMHVWPSSLSVCLHVCKLRQLGCLIARGNHLLLWATMICRRIARLGKFKLEVSLHQSYRTSYKNIQNHVPVNYKPSTYSDSLTHAHIFCYSDMSGQAVLWPSLPDWATKKKENCRSLHVWHISQSVCLHIPV